MDGQRSLADIRDALVQEYNVLPGMAEEDLVEIVGQLWGLALVKEVENAV